MKKKDEIDYLIFIISHGRPNVQKTYEFLVSKHCTKNTFIVCDDLDPTLDEYLKNYGDRVLVFNKKRYMDVVDVFYNVPNPNHPVYARNAVYDLAIERGYRYFVCLDDDMSALRIRTAKAERGTENIDGVFQAVFRFIRDSGVYIYGSGGASSFFGGFKDEMLFTAVNACFCDTQRRVEFKCHYNEDVVTPLAYNKVGKIICATCHIHFFFQADGSNAGGIEYERSFRECYIYCVSALISDPAKPRITYTPPSHIAKIRSGKAHPMILNEKWRKPR